MVRIRRLLGGDGVRGEVVLLFEFVGDGEEVDGERQTARLRQRAPVRTRKRLRLGSGFRIGLGLEFGLGSGLGLGVGVRIKR